MGNIGFRTGLHLSPSNAMQVYTHHTVPALHSLLTYDQQESHAGIFCTIIRPSKAIAGALHGHQLFADCLYHFRHVVTARYRLLLKSYHVTCMQ